MKSTAAWLVAMVLAAASVAAHASYETWTVDELYSNADGSVQYIVLAESTGANSENLLVGQTLTVTRAGLARSFTFDHNLGSILTASKRVLIATAGFAALGAVAPDYVVPNQFLPIDGGTLDYAHVDRFTFGPLPIDGTNALYRSGTVTTNVATNFLGVRASVTAAAVSAIEYYNPILDHYFVSALEPDIDALDSGRIAGWYRTGQSFQVFPTAAAAGSSAAPVCRFYIPPAHGDSHFLSASAVECNAVAQRVGTDPNYSGYVLETPSAFYVALPDVATGACPAGSVPVYRLWNGRPDSNHRYTVDPAIKAQMIARGYTAEGYGPDGVAMCAPASSARAFSLASAASPFAPGCDLDNPSDVLYVNAEVEPRVEIVPGDPDHLIGVWQQDRWSGGGARGLLTGVSSDGGRSWTRVAPPAFSRCTGGDAFNGADYARASDPWITVAPDGTAHQIAISFTGPTFGPTAVNAVMVSRSIDGGFTWSAPTVLMRDARTAFNDKESITADGYDARFVYAVWDRLLQSGGGPAWMSRTTDGGLSWEPARMIYDPGPRAQTLNNQIVVLPDGTLLDFFTEFDTDANGQLSTRLAMLRSGDHGATWSATPLFIASSLAVGVRDPGTSQPVRDAANIGSIAVGRHGELAVVWQDSRFTGGVRDDVLFTQSVDGGSHWSTPARINAAPGVQAFVPTVKIRDDGTIGVTYYDFRNIASDPAGIATDYWLTESTDGVTWRETHVTGPFALAQAPIARGFFLGDYQGLASTASAFLPFFARTNASPANPTDIVAGRPGFAAAGAQKEAMATRAQLAAPVVLTPRWREALHRAALETLQRRWRGPQAEQAPPAAARPR